MTSEEHALNRVFRGEAMDKRVTSLHKALQWARLTPMCVLVMASLLCPPQALFAAGIRAGSGEFNVYGGQLSGDETTTNFRVSGRPLELELESGITGGARFGYNFIPYLGIEGIFNFALNDVKGRVVGTTSSVEGDSRIFGLHANVVVQEGKHILNGYVVPYVTAGIGVLNFDGDARGPIGTFEFNVIDFAFNYGGGIKIFITDNFAFRFDVRLFDTKLENTNDRIKPLEISGGISYFFGGR
jgi:outer membrane beta-barrel protein